MGQGLLTSALRALLGSWDLLGSKRGTGLAMAYIKGL